MRQFMLDFHLSVQPETEKRLKKILNSIKDQEKFAQSIIDYQIAELQKSKANSSLNCITVWSTFIERQFKNETHQPQVYVTSRPQELTKKGSSGTVWALSEVNDGGWVQPLDCQFLGQDSSGYFWAGAIVWWDL